MAGQRNVDDIVDVIDMLDTCEAHVAAGHSVSLSYLGSAQNFANFFAKFAEGPEMPKFARNLRCRGGVV